MTYIGNALTVQNSRTLAFQSVGACIASPLYRRCFSVRMLAGAERFVQQPRTRNARPYAVKENIDYVNVVSIALTASGISILSRETPTLPKHPTLNTRADRGGTPIALTASDISILSRETPRLPMRPT